MTMVFRGRPKGLDTPHKRAEWVLGTITTYPDLHNQQAWIDEGSCGTTRCVGGWTLYAADIPEDILLRRQAGDAFPPQSSLDLAGPLLGLDYADADRLFYYTNDEEAVLALQAIVAGKAIDWEAIGFAVSGEPHFPTDEEYAGASYMDPTPNRPVSA